MSKKLMYIVCMILITAGIFVLPMLYYQYWDIRLSAGSREYRYNADMKQNLDFSEKVNVLARKECIIEENRMYEFSNAVKREAGQAIWQRIEKLSKYDDRIYEFVKNSGESMEEEYPGNYRCFRVLYTEGEDIYTFQVGTYTFEINGKKGFAIYDIDTERIYLVYINLDYNEETRDYEAYGLYKSSFRPDDIFESTAINSLLDGVSWNVVDNIYDRISLRYIFSICVKNSMEVYEADVSYE